VKIVVAYSGGLDTSIMLKWLKDRYQAEIIAFTADVGQAEELDGLEERAMATGASKFYVRDLREEFVRDYVFPAIKANAIYEGDYLLGTALARPVISKHLVDVALAEGAEAIAHGATGKGNDQVRFELCAYSLHPEIKVIAPWREWEMQSRADLLAYADQNGIPVRSSREKPYSMDRNLMHISYEGGDLEEPWNAPTKEMFITTTDPLDAPDVPEDVEIEFEDGTPVAVNGEKLGPADLLTRLNKLGAKHGVGRADIVENRFVGIKSRGVYETPGGTILIAAHKAIESITLDREVLRLRDMLLPRFTEYIYNGFWFSPEMELLLKFMNTVQEGVTGTSKVRLYKGAVHVLGRKSPNSLYSQSIATFDEDSVYEHSDADGFIKLNALRLKLFNYRKRRVLSSGEVDVSGLRDGFLD
jgi:argininosuccinate synthase